MSFLLTAKKYFLKQARPYTVYIIPTKRGFLFVTVAIILILTGFTYNNNSVLIYGFILSSIWLMSKYYTHFNLSKLKIQSCRIKDGFAQSTLAIHGKYKNESSLTKSYLVVELLENKTFVIDDISPYEQSKFQDFIFMSQRGLYHMPRLKLFTTFPLGLFRSWSYHPIAFSFYVYPFAKGLPLPPKAFASAEDEDELESISQTSGVDDFSHHKEYQYGEPLNRIDWKKFSKNKTRQVKTYESPKSTTYSFAWDKCSQLKSEDKLSQLTLWIQLAYEQSARWELILPSKVFPVSKGEKHFRDCLEYLSLYEV